MLEIKDVISIILSLRSDVWLIWNSYTVVTLAFLGWLVSHRKDFDIQKRKVAAAAYIFFYIVMLTTFIKVHWELNLAVHDLNSLLNSSRQTFPEGGFVESIKNTNYLVRLYSAALITTVVSGCLVWLLLWNPKSIFGENPLPSKEGRDGEV